MTSLISLSSGFAVTAPAPLAIEKPFEPPWSSHFLWAYQTSETFEARAEIPDDCSLLTLAEYSKMYVGTVVAIVVTVGLLVVIPIGLACYLGRRWYVVAEFKAAFCREEGNNAGVRCRSRVQDVEQGNPIRMENSVQ